MDAGDFGRSLPRRIGIKLLVTQIATIVALLRKILGAKTIY